MATLPSNTLASVPALAVLGDASLVGDGNFTLTRMSDGGVRAEKCFTNGLHIVKEFHVSSNYLVQASVRLENITPQALTLPAQEVVIGTATPMDADDNNFLGYGGAMWFDGSRAQVCNPTYFNTNTTMLFFIPRTPHSDYRAGNRNVVWGAVFNQFFALAAMPKSPADQIIAQPVTLPPFPNIEQAPGTPPPQGVQAALVYPAVTLSANSSVERQIVVFAGTKEYRTLSRIGRGIAESRGSGDEFRDGFHQFLGHRHVLRQDCCCSAMNALHDLTKLGYGWTIVVITVLLRVIFWPLTANEHALDEADAGAGAGDGRAQGKIQGRPAEIHAEADGSFGRSTTSTR